MVFLNFYDTPSDVTFEAGFVSLLRYFPLNEELENNIVSNLL